MALYVDSAFLDDIALVTRTVPVTGVTTNPTLMRLARERGQDLDHMALLHELLSAVPGPIFTQPGASDEEEMYRQALTYLQADPERIVPKIPMNSAGIHVARRLRSQTKCTLAFTAVTTVAQAYIAALAGADFVIPYYNRLALNGIDAHQRIQKMGTALSQAGLSTRVLVASIKSAHDAEQSLLVGAHDLTINPQLLLDMVDDPLSDEAITRFNQDWRTLNTL